VVVVCILVTRRARISSLAKFRGFSEDVGEYDARPTKLDKVYFVQGINMI